MLTIRSFTFAVPLRFTLAILSGLFLLSGCGSDDKKPDAEQDDKKPAYERVVILKQRFTQLENSLDEMERDLLIQRKRIDSTRETAQSIKRSLLKGGLKGYSMDTVSSDPLVLKAMEKRLAKSQEKKVEREQKEESDDLILNTLLIILFLIFMAVIFTVALKDRNKTPGLDAPVKPLYPDPEVKSTTLDSPVTEADTDSGGSSYTYGQLRPKGNTDTSQSQDDDFPPASDSTQDDEDPRQ